jgi:hypothetical protein
MTSALVTAQVQQLLSEEAALATRKQERRLHEYRKRKRRREEKNAQLEACIALLAGVPAPLHAMVSRDMRREINKDTNRNNNRSRLEIDADTDVHIDGFDALDSWRRAQFAHWADEERVGARYRLDWAVAVPACLDPVRAQAVSRKPGGKERGMRKRRQVRARLFFCFCCI